MSSARTARADGVRHSNPHERRPNATSTARSSDESAALAPSNNQSPAAAIGGRAMAIDYRPFVFYAGNCRDAFIRYQEILGGDLALLTFADAPSEEPVLPEPAAPLRH